jgi:ATP-binding protein involved in chromosome partitioning
MKLDRKKFLKFRNNNYSWEGKNMVESGAIANVITFEMRVVDLVLSTPLIQKRAEDDIKKTIHEFNITRRKGKDQQ